MKTIILNKLYVGNYLKEEKNIGHEVINLFKDDNRNNYIYITPSGYLSKKYDDTVETVLLIQELKGNRVEVIAKAIGLEQIAYKSKDLERKQKEYIKDQSIEYGNVSLDKLMTEDKYNVRVTFKAKEVIKPVAPIYLEIKSETKQSPNKNVFYLKGIKKIMPQSCRRYVPENDENYKILQELINDSTMWERDNTTERIEIDNNTKKLNDFSFMKIIRKEHDELSYSNMISYFLSENPILFKNFCKEILGLETKGTYSIAREENNIDILIRDNKNFVVIENKIKSGINGIKHAIDEKYDSQLSKYYEYAEKKSEGRKNNFFIFSPDYNKLELDKLKKADKYKIITYSELEMFFTKQKDLIIQDMKLYYEEFLKSLKPHTKKIDNSNYEIMYERFLEAIKKAKENG